MQTKDIILPLIPSFLLPAARAFRDTLTGWRNAFRTPEQIFSDIYTRQLWGEGHGEACSGPGSRGELSDEYVSFVASYVIANRIRSIVDIGVGDFHVGRALLTRLKEMSWDVQYTGCDVVAALIEKHVGENTSPSISFRHLDAIADPLPEGELCLVRQVLQHLSNEAAGKVLMKVDRFAHAIITEHHPAPQNLVIANADKATGGNVRVTKGSGIFPNCPPFNHAYRLEKSMAMKEGVVLTSESDESRCEILAIFVKENQDTAQEKSLKLLHSNPQAA